MDRKIALLESFNVSDTSVQFITDDTAVFRAGNTLVFMSTTNRKKQIISFDHGTVLDSFAVIQSPPTASGGGSGFVVCGVHSPDAAILLYDFPARNLIRRIIPALAASVAAGGGAAAADAEASSPVSGSTANTTSITIPSTSGVTSAPSEAYFSLMAASRDGKYLATICKIGASQLSIWELATGTRMVSYPVMDDWTFLSFNPFNNLQLLTGHSKRVTVWALGPHTPFQLPTLTPSNVAVELENQVDRQIVCHSWVADSKLACGSRGGEILMCDIPRPQPPGENSHHQAAVRHATMAAAAAAASAMNSGANTARAPVPTIGANGELQVNPDGSFQSLSNEAQVALVQQMGVNKLVHDEEAERKPEEVRISLSVLMQRLPLAHNAETYGVGEEKDDEVAGIAYSMTVTARHLVIGTEDGVIFWLNLATYQISYVQRLERDLSVDAGSPTANSGSAICSLSFSPSFASFLALNLRGHLQMIRVIGDPSRIDLMGDERRRILQNARDQAARAAANGNDDDDDGIVAVNGTRSQPPPALSTLPHISGIGGEPMFSCISLGHYAVAMGIRSRALVRFGVAPIPITATQADSGLVTPPRMVTWGASGWLQLWWYQPTKELLCSHAFRSAITSCCPSPDGALVVVGLRCGGVCALDISRPRVLRMVFSHRLHQGAVVAINFNSDGSMFSSADSKTVYFVRNTDLRVAGYISIADTLKEHRQSLYAAKRATEDEEKEKAAKELEANARATVQSPNHPLLSPQPAGAGGRTAAANAKSFAQALEQKEKEAAELAASQAAALAAEKKAIDDEEDLVTCAIWLTADRSPGEAAPPTGFAEYRLLVTTARGSTIVLRAPDIAYDGHDIVLSSSVTQPVIRSIPIAARSLKYSRFGTNRIFALTSDKMLKLYQVYGDGRLELVSGAAAHIKPGNTLAFTSDASLMATAGADGLIALWDGEANQMIARFSAHDFSVGGVTECCFSDDSTLLLTSGCDGGVFCWDITSVSSGREARALKPRPVVVVRTRVLDSIDDAGDEPSIETPLYADSEGYDRVGRGSHTNVTHNPMADKDLARRKARDEVARAIEKFRERFQEVMRRNERSSELEQLPLNEFAIDVEMRDTLIEMGRQQVAKIRIEIETSCQGKELVASRIKEQCWDRMEVKGLTFRSFKTGNEMSNFPLRSVPASEIARTAKIQFLRKMEIMETRWIRQANLAADDDVTDKEFRAEKFTEEVSYIMNVEESGEHINKYGTMSPPGTAATPSTGNIAQGSGAAAAASKRRAAAAAAANNAATPSPLPSVTSPMMGTTSISGEVKVGGLSSAMPAPATTASGGNTGGGSSLSTSVTNKADKPKEEDEFKGLITTFPSFLLYHPFACITSCRKRSQAALLAAKIETLKRAFNDQFTEFYALKKREIESISGKAVRIAEIQHELQLEHVVYRPVLTPDEIADSVLYVDDSEVKAERVLTGAEAEMKAKRELLEGMQRAAADDAPERALQTMMGGTLENKRDLSALELELSRQPWMDLPAEKMTEDQKSELAQFQKKVKLIEAERETRKKLLQTELSKLRNDVSDVCRTFDSKFKGLYNTRVNTQRDIYLHELMIIKIMNDLVKEERQVYDEGGVVRRLNQLRDAKSRAYLEFLEFKRKADLVSKEYEVLVAEEKQMERHFRRDFSDAGEFVDYLARLYKTRKIGRAVAAPSKLPPVRVSSRARKDGRPVSGRRSSVSSAGSQHAGAAVAAAAAAAAAGAAGAIETNRSTSPRTTISGASRVTRPRKGKAAVVSNPLADAQAHEEEITARRAESDTLNPYAEIAPTELEDVKYADLNASDMPPQLNVDTWNRFLERRRLHIDKEMEIKRLGSKHYEMQKHLGYLQSVDVAVANEIASLTNKRVTMQQEQAAVALNTELMLRIRQGQVEIEEAPVVTDLKDCEMLDRSIVESLNDAIVKLGREKVEMMRDITASKTQIHFDNWQNKRLDLEHKDAVDQTTELQLLRVTKSLQLLIKMGGRDHQKAVELKKLDRKIDFLSAAGREQDMGQKLVFNKYQKKIRQQTRENERLAETVQQLEAAVKERQQISAIREDDSKDREKGASNRMRALVTRRKLIDLAKLQGEEIKFLKNQVETLRRRTFASFSIPQIAHNPDETKVAQQMRSPSSMSRSVSRNQPIPAAPSRASGGAASRAGAVSAMPTGNYGGGDVDSRAGSRADLPSRAQTR